MIVNISINGVIRDFWTKLQQEYRKYYLETESAIDETFVYEINDVVSDDIMKRFNFQSEEEMKYFLFVEAPMEIFGHAAPIYKNVSFDVLQYAKQEKVKINLVSKEIAKSIPATFFFLSKTALAVNSINFYQQDSELHELWNNCDIWITDDPTILKMKPVGKLSIKVLQDYNETVKADKTINSLADLIVKDEELQTREISTD